MKVQATRWGYYDDKRRRPGSVFEVDEKMFSEVWMEKVSEDEPLKNAKRDPRATGADIDFSSGREPIAPSAGSKAVHTGDKDEATGRKRGRKPKSEKSKEDGTGSQDVI